MLPDEIHSAWSPARVVGMDLGAEIHSSHVIRALTSDRGGLKNIPDSARRILVINQIDSFPNWRTFLENIKNLLESYQTVAFTVLEDEMLLEVHQPIAGIILAAGGSTRFGQLKQTLDWKGMPLVAHIKTLALEAGLSPVVVVTGAEAERVEAAARNDVILVHNPNWQEGQSTSVGVGIEALPARVGAAIFFLVDQPLIEPELVRRLSSQFARGGAEIVYPDLGERPGNPVLFSRAVFDELRDLTGDQGGKSLIKSVRSKGVPWNDLEGQQDLDTPEDYQRLLDLSA